MTCITTMKEKKTCLGPGPHKKKREEREKNVPDHTKKKSGPQESNDSPSGAGKKRGKKRWPCVLKGEATAKKVVRPLWGE